MKIAAKWLTALMLTTLSGACDRAEKGETGTDTTAADPGSTAAGEPGVAPRANVARLDYPGSQAGLESLLSSSFASATAKPAEVVSALTPDVADYEAVFEGDAAGKVRDNTDRMLRQPPAKLGEAGDAVKVFAVTAEDLKSGNEAAGRCPGGYARIASKIKAGATLYCTKVGGTSYDAFAHVNGHWVWFPKAFRAFRD